jgi:hypothetical protein
VRATINELIPSGTPPPELSEHVLAALTYLDEAVEGKPRIEEAAEVARISPSRLSNRERTHEALLHDAEWPAGNRQDEHRKGALHGPRMAARDNYAE